MLYSIFSVMCGQDFPDVLGFFWVRFVAGSLSEQQVAAHS
jgi:hypothetical protein